MHPKTFRDIIGQQKATIFLQQVVANDKLASAYLFTGIRGVGKTTAAAAFALLVNCADPVEGDGCGECSSCRRIMDGNHPDFIVVKPDQTKKVISIDQIREVARQLAFSPVLGRYRVIITDPAERMTDEAANAFLKTLEEPPPRNILILNVRDPGELLPTIVSRCQKVSFKPLPTRDIVKWLVKEGGIEREKATIFARLSEGSLGRALALAEEELFAERVGWIDMLQGLIGGSTEDLIDNAQKLSGLERKTAAARELKDDTAAFMLGIWKSWYRDLLLVKLGCQADLVVNSDLRHLLAKAVRVLTVQGIMRSLEVIARAERDVMTNKNLAFLIERSLFDLRRAAQLS
jgi:DNA polymerase-3 subunit delta'